MEYIAKGDELKLTPQFYMIDNDTIVNLTDTFNIWLYDKDIIFNLDTRLAGHIDTFDELLVIEDVNTYLQENNISNILDNSITYENYNNTMLVKYNKEVDDYKKWKRAVIKYNINNKGLSLSNLITLFTPETSIDKKTKFKEFNKTRKYLNRKIEQVLLKTNKVLDVSEIDSYGDNVMTISSLSTNKKPFKFGSPKLPIVSSDLQRYLYSLTLISNMPKLTESDIEYVKNLFEQNEPVVFTYQQVVST
jgi:hypothetical protein